MVGGFFRQLCVPPFFFLWVMGFAPLVFLFWVFLPTALYSVMRLDIPEVRKGERRANGCPLLNIKVNRLNRSTRELTTFCIVYKLPAGGSISIDLKYLAVCPQWTPGEKDFSIFWAGFDL